MRGLAARSARPSRQTEMIEGAEHANALHMVEAGGVRGQGVTGILKDAPTSSPYPEFTRLLILRISGTLNVHKNNFHLFT